MSAVDSLLYISVARPGMTDAEFDALLIAARRNNERRGLTGVLLKYGDRFVQVLEGPPEAVDACFAAIAADPRHGDVRVVQRVEARERRFGEWSMRNVHFAFGSDKVVDAFLTALAADRPDPGVAERAVELLLALSRRAAPG